jgi:ribA/ribD-fused uncharacterized protein
MTKKKQKNPHTNNKKQEEISQGLEHPERYFFFWKKESPFSQWHDSPYECNGYTYTCAEQGMMHCKALLFGDEHSARAILQETTDPRKVKALGRQVQNFSADIWNDNREQIVQEQNVAKFTQNPPLRKALMRTGDRMLVEASPQTISGALVSTKDKPSGLQSVTGLDSTCLAKP